uniref:Uncharacterized protein n=1 Tax=Aegilops tauschii subsp. strangulata TaxID=200361 RepID=A0A453EW36_AEGTS
MLMSASKPDLFYACALRVTGFYCCIICAACLLTKLNLLSERHVNKYNSQISARKPASRGATGWRPNH